jgi:uncharacterized protein
VATIFISYSRKDTDFVQLLEPRIHNIYGFASLWYDKSREGIQGGDDWWTTIINKIRDCQLFLFLMSDTSVNSEYCQKELQKAIYNQKVILPVLLKTYSMNYPDSLPEDLSDYMRNVQYIDLRNGYDDLSLLWGAINRIRDHSLSEVNRWMLYNQFETLRLLHKLVDQPGNAEDYEKQQEIISMGYEWNYDRISEHIMPAMEYGDGEEVITILDMYRAIHNACVQDVDRADIDSVYLRFRGFDGNYETDYYSFARFIIEDEDKFAESSPDNGSDLNSHSPMLPKYRRMVEQWKLSEKQHSLTKEEIIRILDA